jgi:lysophospholipase L1-like esterase
MQRPFERFLVILGVALLVAMAASGFLGQHLLWQKYAGGSKGVNVRLVDRMYRLGFIDWYIIKRLQASTKPLIVIIGDSQPYGYGLPDNEIVSARLQALLPAYEVINLSLQGGHVTDAEVIARQLRENGVRPRYIISSFKPTDVAQREGPRLGSIAIPPAFYFANLQKLLSMEARFSEVPGFARLRDDQFRYYDNLFLDEYVVRDGQLALYLELLRNMIAEARRTADKVIMFANAFETGSMAVHYGLDVGAYRRDAQAAVEACAETGAVCVDLTMAFPHPFFFDLAHLNRAGHRALAEILAKYIEPTPSP